MNPIVSILAAFLWFLFAGVMFALAIVLKGVFIALVLVVIYAVLTVLGFVPPIDLPLVP